MCKALGLVLFHATDLYRYQLLFPGGWADRWFASSVGFYPHDMVSVLFFF